LRICDDEMHVDRRVTALQCAGIVHMVNEWSLGLGRSRTVGGGGAGRWDDEKYASTVFWPGGLDR
jgi:hypothetical protein